MPCTKNNFSQLREWCTLNQLNRKGFMPTGEPFRLVPTGYRLEGIDYYSPYEIRPMTDDELQAYNVGRKSEARQYPGKQFGTLLDKLRKFYSCIRLENGFVYGKLVVTQKLLRPSRQSYGGDEIAVTVHDDDGNDVFTCRLLTVCTRITRGSKPFIFDDYNSAVLDEEDKNCIKSVPDINNITNQYGLVRLKQFFVGAEQIEFAHYDSFRYIDFKYLLGI